MCSLLTLGTEHHELSHRCRRRHGQRGPGNAVDLERAPVPREGGACARLPPVGRRGGVVRRRHAEMQGPGDLRLLQARLLPDVGGRSVSKEWSPKIAAKGCVVIDNSSAWRYDMDVPLIVPEVNADAVAGYAKKNIIANPNCSTMQMVVALKPLHDRATIKRVVVCDLSVGVRRRQGRHGRAVEPDQGQVRAGPGGRAQEVPQGDRLQLHSALRRLHGGRLHPRGMEDGGRDQEDPRPHDQGDGDLRARAGIRRPLRGGERRVRAAALGRGGFGPFYFG